MNKKQKRDQVKARRFHQQVSKKTKELVLVELKPQFTVDSFPASEYSINMDLVHKLSIKELEYVIDKQDYEGNDLVIKALTLELSERRLLLATKP